MILANIISAICLAGLSAEFLYFVISLIVKNRAERIAFIRGFKKGSCILIYLIALPLFFVGYFYSGHGFLTSIFEGIPDIIGLVVLKYNMKGIATLMSANLFYRIVIYVCFILVAINALLFTFSLAGQRMWAFFRSFTFRFSHREKLYVFGYNADNVNVYKSDDKRAKVIIGEISRENTVDLYAQKIYYISTKRYKAVIHGILKGIKRLDKRNVIIINTKDDTVNMQLCRAFADVIGFFDSSERNKVFLRMSVYVFGDSRYETIYNDIVSDSAGCIKYVNKYRKIAVDFVDKYPFTRFMDERHIDKKNALLKDNVSINVLMIGFGKTNRQIFLTSVANNQFLKRGEKGPEPVKVKYSIFDRVDSQNNKNLNHDYYRFKNEIVDFDKDEYLPLPALPAHEDYFKLDINDVNFYKTVRKVISKDENDVNLVIIAFGSDLENIDMAQKLIQKRDEWGIYNFSILVKARAWSKENSFLEQQNCYFIGNEREVIFNIENITNDKIFNMALMRNEIYSREHILAKRANRKVCNKLLDVIRVRANEEWFTRKTQLERESSTYCCLSLRSKLQMMGLDYVDADAEVEGLSESEYMSIYGFGDMPDVVRTENGKKVVRYSLDFPDSIRKNLAVQEHQRWNSFMISKGLIPASIKQILEETETFPDGSVKHTNGKNYKLRRHGNITTFDGLGIFRKLIAERDDCDENLADVFKYDYQLMDEAYDLLKANGYKIIKKLTIE